MIHAKFRQPVFAERAFQQREDVFAVAKIIKAVRVIHRIRIIQLLSKFSESRSRRSSAPRKCIHLPLAFLAPLLSAS